MTQEHTSAAVRSPGEKSSAGLDRRQMFFICAGLLLATHITDYTVARQRVPLLLAVRIAWAACLVFIAWRSPQASRRGLRVLTILGGLASVLGLTLLVGFTGGAQSPYFAFTYVLPIAFGVLVPDDPPTAVVNGAAMAVSGTAMLLHAGQREQLWVWLPIAVTVSVLATWGAVLYRRMHERELRSAFERTEAMAQLAVSEERRQRSERMALIGQLSAGVAHEINNPLAYVKSNLEHLERHEVVPATELREIVSEALNGVERIQRIVSDLKTFARQDASMVGPCDLPQVIQSAIRMSSVRTQHRAQIREELAADLPPVSADPGRLTQVLVNLLVNAAEAIEEGAVPQGWIRISATAGEGAVRICVEDNGPGLPAQSLSRLFSPFFTTKPPGKGTGLGLAISREYLQAFGGSIDGSNRPDGGARFELRLRPV